MTTTFNGTMADTNCSPDAPLRGEKGLTIWGPRTTDIFVPHGGQTVGPFYFTCTQPQCYENNPGFCNVYYTIHTEQTSNNADVGPIHFILNGLDSTHYHSSIAGHDLNECI